MNKQFAVLAAALVTAAGFCVAAAPAKPAALAQPAGFWSATGVVSASDWPGVPTRSVLHQTWALLAEPGCSTCVLWVHPHGSAATTTEFRQASSAAAWGGTQSTRADCVPVGRAVEASSWRLTFSPGTPPLTRSHSVGSGLAPGGTLKGTEVDRYSGGCAGTVTVRWAASPAPASEDLPWLLWAAAKEAALAQKGYVTTYSSATLGDVNTTVTHCGEDDGYQTYTFNQGGEGGVAYVDFIHNTVYVAGDILGLEEFSFTDVAAKSEWPHWISATDNAAQPPAERSFWSKVGGAVTVRSAVDRDMYLIRREPLQLLPELINFGGREVLALQQPYTEHGHLATVTFYVSADSQLLPVGEVVDGGSHGSSTELFSGWGPLPSFAVPSAVPLQVSWLRPGAF